MRLNLAILLLLFAIPSVVLGVDNPRDRLERLRAEIDSLSGLLQESRTRETDIGGKISALDMKISIRRKLIRELEKQLAGEHRAVSRYESRISDSQRNLRAVRGRLTRAMQQVVSLEDLIRRRAVFVYKRGSRESLRFLMAADSPGDFFRRRMYVRRIHDRDRNNLEKLRQARQYQAASETALQVTLRDLAQARDRRAMAVERSEKLVSEGQQERRRLEHDRKNFSSLFESIQRDRKAISTLISDRETALRQVEDWITTLERDRARGVVQEIRVKPRTGDILVHDVENFGGFAKGRGRLPWPVKGRVVRNFGLETNKITGTVTENPGIDIQAPVDSEVIAVQGGICTRITYLRGFGTTVLIDHGQGYYTVYAQLGDIWVSEGEEVHAGRVLGTIGTSQTTGKPRLHFQVWHKRKKQDPLKWLSS